MKDLILCRCRTCRAVTFEGGRMSHVGLDGSCCHPTEFINIDRLLRIEEAARDLITNNLNAINMGEIIGAANLYGALHANPGGSDEGESMQNM